MKVVLTLRHLLEIEESLVSLRKEKHRTKFARQVKEATRPFYTALKEWYEYVDEKQRELGEQNPTTGRWAIKPGTDAGKEFEKETRALMDEFYELTVNAIPYSEFEKSVPNATGEMIDDLTGIVLDDGNGAVNDFEKQPGLKRVKGPSGE